MTLHRPTAITGTLRNGLVVSCQAPPGDPMRETGTLLRLARSAEAGGATAVRAEGPEVIAAIARSVALPLIEIGRAHV